MVSVERSHRKIKSDLYYERVDKLAFDPKRIIWNEELGFLSYSTKIGRNLERPTIGSLRSRGNGLEFFVSITTSDGVLPSQELCEERGGPVMTHVAQCHGF